MVKAKTIPIALVDRAVARVLRLKFELGLFEEPYVDVAQADTISGSAEHAALARKAAAAIDRAAEERGRAAAPRRARVKTLAVIGPNAEPCRLGGYSGVPERCVGLLRGIREAAGRRRQGDVGAGLRHHHRRSSDWWADTVEPSTPAEDRKMIDDAVIVAKRADVVVLAVGDNEQTSREAWAANHLGDRSSLDLVGRQNELVGRRAGAGQADGASC